jgi:adenine-specific DNA-methyltransferase
VTTATDNIISSQIEERIERLSRALGLTYERPGEVVSPWWRESGNWFGRFDNLEFLRRMIAAEGVVDFCYIDPPYNTGNDFIYHDSRRSKAGGLWGIHHPWMQFMLPRLAYAQCALAETGLIAVSIDDYAAAHWRILMDLTFGEDNFIGSIVVCRSKNGRGSNKNIATMHEYVVIYGKSAKATLLGLKEQGEREYQKADQFGSFTLDGLFRKKGDASLREDRPNMFYPLYYAADGQVFTEQLTPDLLEVWPRDSKGVDRRWLWGKEKATEESWRLYASKGGVIYVKNYQQTDKRVKLRSILSRPEYLTDAATREVKQVYGEKLFDTPKPLRLIRDLVDACSGPHATVLDFFAGSGTTAHAVAVMNAEEGAKRSVILIEHESCIPRSHAAANAGFASTADLTAFRLDWLTKSCPSFSYSLIPPQTP